MSRQQVSHRMRNCPLRVLHVEVGGAYGGSVRALEVYLRHSAHGEFVHDVALYYPTSGAGRLKVGSGEVTALYDAAPREWRPLRGGSRSRLWEAVRRSRIGSLVSQAGEVTKIMGGTPVVRRVGRLLERGEYDVVHVNNTFPYQWPTILAAYKRGIPIIAHVRNPVPECALNRLLMRVVDCVTPVAVCYERELTRWRVPTPVHTCYDSVELIAPDLEQSALIRTRIAGPAGDSVFIGSAGRLVPQKGYQHFVRAARRVLDVRSDVRFAISGEGPERDALEGLIGQLGLGRHFSLCGFLPPGDATSFVAALDVFVCPSEWEGLPTTVVEALLLGKLVIATDVGGTSELVIPGKTGYLVPPRDINALADAMISAINAKDTQSMTSAGRRAAAALTEPQANAHRFDRLLQDVARRRHAVAAAPAS